MSNIYRDIAERTNGDIYIGVVGPVRTGKSTFVSRFVNQLVLPNIADANSRKRATDELPQSAEGKMIMTTQPNFVPNDAVRVKLANKSTANIRLIDCVGYLVEGAEGHLDGDKDRLVTTPWSNKPMTFGAAAELGTEKVVKEHSTVAVVVTSDGSIADIVRTNYVSAEEKVINQLKECGKPFVVVLNSANADSADAVSLAQALTEKYGCNVIPLNVLNCTDSQFEEVLSAILYEFPIKKVCFDMPNWMRTLDSKFWLIEEILDTVKTCCNDIYKMKQCSKLESVFDNSEHLEKLTVAELEMGKGIVHCTITPKPELFYQILSEQAQADITDQFNLMKFVVKSAYAKSKYESIQSALESAESTGYGVVCPQDSSMKLCPPEIVKQGSKYGVKLKASAPSLHIMRIDVATEVSPMVGTEQQSQYLLSEFNTNPDQIWQTNMFGKSLSSLVQEGLTEKCINMPQEIKDKLVKTTSRIVNESKGGLICLLL